MSRLSPIAPSAGSKVLVVGPVTFGVELAATVSAVNPENPNLIDVELTRGDGSELVLLGVEYDDDATQIAFAVWRWPLADAPASAEPEAATEAAQPAAEQPAP
jgi:hypothetical protein